MTDPSQYFHRNGPLMISGRNKLLDSDAQKEPPFEAEDQEPSSMILSLSPNTYACLAMDVQEPSADLRAAAPSVARDFDDDDAFRGERPFHTDRSHIEFPSSSTHPRLIFPTEQQHSFSLTPSQGIPKGISDKALSSSPSSSFRSNPPWSKQEDEGYASWEPPSHLSQQHPISAMEGVAGAKSASLSRVGNFLPELIFLICSWVKRLQGSTPESSPLAAQLTLSKLSMLNRHWRLAVLPWLWRAPVLTKESQFKAFIQSFALASSPSLLTPQSPYQRSHRQTEDEETLLLFSPCLSSPPAPPSPLSAAAFYSSSNTKDSPLSATEPPSHKALRSRQASNDALLLLNSASGQWPEDEEAELLLFNNRHKVAKNLRQEEFQASSCSCSSPLRALNGSFSQKPPLPPAGPKTSTPAGIPFSFGISQHSERQDSLGLYDDLEEEDLHSSSSSFLDLKGHWIRHLDLSKIRLYEPSHKQAFELLAFHCHSLQTLRLWVEDFTLETLQDLVSSSPSLQSLYVMGHLRPTGLFLYNDAPLKKSIRGLKRLHIDMGYEGDPTRSKLAKLFMDSLGPDLIHFWLSGSGSTVQNLRKVLKKCPNLESLFYSWGNLPTEALFLMGEQVRCLKTLNVRGCTTAVHPQGLAALLQGCPRLSHLDLSFTNDTDACLYVLSDRAKALETLIFSGCELSEDAMLTFLENRGQSLTTLSLSWCVSALTEKVILALAAHCPQLEKLDIRGIPGQPLAALRQLVQKCSKLRVLKVEERLALAALGEHGPTLEGTQRDGIDAALGVAPAPPPPPPTRRQNRRRRASSTQIAVSSVAATFLPASFSRQQSSLGLSRSVPTRTGPAVRQQSLVFSLSKKFPSDEAIGLEEDF